MTTFIKGRFIIGRFIMTTFIKLRHESFRTGSSPFREFMHKSLGNSSVSPLGNSSVSPLGNSDANLDATPLGFYVANPLQYLKIRGTFLGLARKGKA